MAERFGSLDTTRAPQGPIERLRHVCSVARLKAVSKLGASRTLAEGWEALTTTRQRSVVADFSVMLRALDTWRPPDDVVLLVRDRPDLRFDSPEGIYGSDINPVPISRALMLAPYVRGCGTSTRDWARPRWK